MITCCKGCQPTIGIIIIKMIILMPSKMEVASQHYDTVPNKTKDILDTVKIERIF